MKEVNMANGEHWFEDMAKALKRRDHAVRMMNRWMQEMLNANEVLETLAAQVPTGVPAAAEQAQAQVAEQETEHDTVLQ